MLFRFARIAPLTLALALICSAPAFAESNYYFVQGTGDGSACAPIEGYTTFLRCDGLRVAVDAASAHANTPDDSVDLVYLQAAGEYTVSTPLALSDRIMIVGRGPRTTTVRGGGTARVFTVAAGAEAYLHRLTIAGGRAPGAEGGNILNAGDLYLLNVRVTAGAAGAGGGIASTGGLFISNSLIDSNFAVSFSSTPPAHGGGIRSQGTLSINNSTIAFNQINGEIVNGGGLASTGDTTLNATTVARNVIAGGGAAGVYSGAANNPIDALGSLIAANMRGTTLANCSGPIDNSTVNVEDGATCGFRTVGNPGLGAALENQGGDTDVLTIAPTGVAKGAVSPCAAGNDQRLALRNASGVCDAGAFEEGATAPPIDSGEFAEPPVLTPTVPQLPAPPQLPAAQEPTPVVNQTVVAREVRGTVKVKLRGSNRFVDLDASQGIPVGSTVDTKKGTVEIASIPKAGQPVQKAEFHDGIFRVTQSKGITDLKLSEALNCPRGRASAAQKKPKKRKLWGKGTGKFRTTGSYSAATIRGTEWLVEDTCTTTTTRVKVGVVSIRDTVKKRTVIRRAGQRYTARARR